MFMVRVVVKHTANVIMYLISFDNNIIKDRTLWLTLLLRIWEVSGSNLGPETGYTD
jgi:hypothetical protein